MDNNCEWRPIPGYENYYLASNTGLVKSLSRPVKRKRGSYVSKEKILSPVDNGKGYKGVSISVDNRVYRLYIHRLVASAFLVRSPGFDEVNHKDGDKSNNRVENLEWVTKSGNCQHAYDTGLHTAYDRRGKKNPRYMHGLKELVNDPKKCRECGADFIAKYKTTIFCSFLCSGRYKVKRMAALKQEAQYSSYGNNS